MKMGITQEPQSMTEVVAMLDEGFHPPINLIHIVRKVASDEIAALLHFWTRREEGSQRRGNWDRELVAALRV
jgi:hypothetical protein